MARRPQPCLSPPDTGGAIARPFHSTDALFFVAARGFGRRRRRSSNLQERGSLVYRRMKLEVPLMREASKFGAATTADVVLEGIDLSGKLMLITGGSSGLGQETARALAAHGAHVVLTARNVAN